MLFRCVAMAVPDRRFIIQAKIALAGFIDDQLLARKVDTVFRLCEEQLSRQPFYEFGLRGILAVLRAASVIKRSLSEGFNEMQLFVRALQDAIIPRLRAEDVQPFLSLLDDVFLSIHSETIPNGSAAQVQTSVTREITHSGLQRYTPWVKKIMQLYEASVGNHGMIVVGPPGVGKSTAISTLCKALSEPSLGASAYKVCTKRIS